MRKSRMWMLAMAIASGSPFSAEEDQIMDVLNPSADIIRTEPFRSDKDDGGGLDFQSGEISQIRSDAMEEHCRNLKLKERSQHLK